jgi:hypothetical protein
MRHDARDVLRLAQPFEPRKLFGVAPSTDCRTGARTVSGTIADGGPDNLSNSGMDSIARNRSTGSVKTSGLTRKRNASRLELLKGR